MNNPRIRVRAKQAPVFNMNAPGGSRSSISEQTCSKCQEGILNQIVAVDGKIEETKRVAEKRLDIHDEQMAQLIESNAKLTQIAQQLSEGQKDAKEATKEAAEAVKSAPKWYQIEWVANTMPFLIKAGIVLLIFIVGAAIGRDIWPQLQGIAGGAAPIITQAPK